MLHRAAKAWWQRQPEERRWLLGSIAAWTILLPVSAWVDDQDGPQWSLVSGPLGAVSNVASTAVVGALLVDRIKAVRRRQWLRAHADDVLHWHWVIRELAADLVLHAYGMLAASSTDNPVPEHYLRADVERHPKAPPTGNKTSLRDLLESIDDLSQRIGNWTHGPLAVARDQVDDLCRGLTRYREQLRHRRAEDEKLSLLLDEDGHWAGPDLPDGPDLRPELVRQLAADLDARVISRCMSAAEGIVEVSARLRGTDTFDPPSIDRAAYEVLRATRRLEVADDDELERAAHGSYAVLSLLAAVISLRERLHSATKDLVGLIGRYSPDTPVHELFEVLVAESLDEGWQNWLVLNGRARPSEDAGRPTPAG